jgi:hypothetical protein
MQESGDMPARRSIVLVGLLMMPVACSAADTNSPTPSGFGSIEEALAFVETKVTVPVVMPGQLPEGTHLASPESVIVSDGPGGPRAQLTLSSAQDRQIILMYGRSGFDGCGADPRPIDILGHPGLLNSHDEWTDVIWPVRDGAHEGRYGVMGQLPRRQLIALAESMSSTPVSPPSGGAVGC